jgi:hypothetical protein
VAWRVNQELGLTVAGWGDARNWDDAAQRAGYAVDSSPRPGDIAVWEGYYGHVAFVVAVNMDSTVNVEQYNRAGKGEFSRESRLRAAHYIHLKPAVAVVPPPSPPATPAPVSVPSAPVTAKPIEPDLSHSPVPVPHQTAGSNPLASTPTTDYLVAVSPVSHQANVYAIQHSETITGQVEISKSNGDDGNASWEYSRATVLVAHGKDEVSYSLADYDGNGTLDLYAVKYAQSTSRNVEITVLSGSTGYKTMLGSWRSNEATHATDRAAYAVADYDGDGKLDMYKITNPTPTKKRTVTILSGAQNFSQTLGEWESNEPNLSDDSYYALGDYDRDGKADLYQISQNPTAKAATVQVFDAGNEYKNTFRRWQVTD